jgi:hypothetical protein
MDHGEWNTRCVPVPWDEESSHGGGTPPRLTPIYLLHWFSPTLTAMEKLTNRKALTLAIELKIADFAGARPLLDCALRVK